MSDNSLILTKSIPMNSENPQYQKHVSTMDLQNVYSHLKKKKINETTAIIITDIHTTTRIKTHRSFHEVLI